VAEASDLDNAALAERLDAFAALLDLADRGAYASRAYRRAAELIRTTPAPVAELVRAGRARELRGVGPGIEARLTELVETGTIAELEQLEREVEPGLVGLGRLLGIGAQRFVEIARALDVHTVDEFRAAAEAGRLREAPGVGPATEQKLLAGLAREPKPRRGLLLNRARELVDRVAAELGGVPAGDPRRWCDLSHRLAVVVAAHDPRPVLERFATLPLVVAVIERDERSALGVTVEGVPLELVVAPPGRFGTELVRATGSAAYVRSLGELPDAPDERLLYERLGLPLRPPELREAGAPEPPTDLVELGDVRGDLHVHTTWSDGRATVPEMAKAARDLGYEYLAICDHTPNVRVVPGLDADALRRQGDEIAAANAELAPFRILRGSECDIRADGSLDLPDDVLAELDWVQLSLHAGQRQRGDELTRKVTEAMRHPSVTCLSHPKGRILNHRPPNELDLERVLETALETGVALEINGLPDRLDLCDVDARLVLDAGVPLVCSTDAHSVRGLRNMALSVATARRAGAPATAILNTRPLAELLAR
jgi:DNA polymerase (family 10)